MRTVENKNAQPDSADCPETVEKMSDYLENELDSGARNRLEKHFANCPLCMKVLQTFKKTLEIFRRKEPEAVPPDLDANLRKKLKTEP
jgi:anti-sigma factor (TIGR02949 family)